MAWSSGIHGLTSAAATAIAHHPTVVSHAQMDTMTLFGCISAFATAVSYVYCRRSRAAMFTFALALAASGLYGFLEGAWPLGTLETAWAFEAARRGLLPDGRHVRRKPAFAADLASRRSRYREVYGSN